MDDAPDLLVAELLAEAAHLLGSVADRVEDLGVARSVDPVGRSGQIGGSGRARVPWKHGLTTRVMARRAVLDVDLSAAFDRLARVGKWVLARLVGAGLAGRSRLHEEAEEEEPQHGGKVT